MPLIGQRVRFIQEYVHQVVMEISNVQLDFTVVLFITHKQFIIGNPGDYGISLDDDGVYNDSVIQYGIGTF